MAKRDSSFKIDEFLKKILEEGYKNISQSAGSSSGSSGGGLPPIGAPVGVVVAKTFLEIAKEFQTHSSTRISDRIDPAGYSQLSIVNDTFVHTCHVNNIDADVNLWMSDEIFAGIPASTRNKLNVRLNMYRNGYRDRPTDIYSINFNFIDGKGKLIVCQIAFLPEKNNVERITCAYRTAMTSFVPSAPYVIITESSKDFFGSESHQRIEYLPNRVTDDHVKSVTRHTLGMIIGYDNILSGLLEKEQHDRYGSPEEDEDAEED